MSPSPSDSGGDRPLFDAYGRTAEFRIILGIAGAIRAEFGADVDAHPGGPGTEAGQVNRAYRAMARRIIRTIVPPREDLPGLVTWTLRQAARRRLIEARLPGPTIESLLDAEPRLGDAWPAYLALAPPSVIRDLLEPEHPDLD